jgi:hypothetical protein
LLFQKLLYGELVGNNSLYIPAMSQDKLVKMLSSPYLAGELFLETMSDQEITSNDTIKHA